MTAAHQLRRNYARCEKVYDVLADEHSRFVFLSAVIGRVFQRFKCAMRGNLFTDRCATAPQYFPQEILTIRDGETYIDCGVFDGDSLAIFAMEAWRRRIQNWSAIGIEADSRNVELARRNLREHGLEEVEIIEAAVGSGKESVSSMHLHNCRGQSLTAAGNSVPLDELLMGCQPTYMKFDIEGAEMVALLGSQRIIECCKPKIAVCVYHSTRDLIEIPLFLAERYPFYRIYMRHHKAGSLWETVCYAVPDQ
jgi:FkbM family methyltransferase